MVFRSFRGNVEVGKDFLISQNVLCKYSPVTFSANANANAKCNPLWMCLEMRKNIEDIREPVKSVTRECGRSNCTESTDGVNKL